MPISLEPNPVTLRERIAMAKTNGKNGAAFTCGDDYWWMNSHRDHRDRREIMNSLIAFRVLRCPAVANRLYTPENRYK